MWREYAIIVVPSRLSRRIFQASRALLALAPQIFFRHRSGDAQGRRGSLSQAMWTRQEGESGYNLGTFAHRTCDRRLIEAVNPALVEPVPF